ncbi:unnamed protein product [Malus baccata var. baccata]
MESLCNEPCLMPFNRTRQDKTRRNGERAKMPSDGNKEEEEGDGESFQGVRRKENSSRGTARSTHFRRTKRGTKHLIPLCSVPSHVPNNT